MLNVSGDNSETIDSATLSKLRWRARRGMLENDIVLTKFFDKYGSILSVNQASALEVLLDLSDNDLLDFILKRSPLKQEWQDNKEILNVLDTLQNIY